MTIFYVMYEATPNADSEEFGTCGGGFVNCWVRAKSECEAEKLAAVAISEHRWTILSIEEECCEVTEDWYSENDEEWESYQQAITDGECYVFHQWPLEAKEGDDVH